MIKDSQIRETSKPQLINQKETKSSARKKSKTGKNKSKLDYSPSTSFFPDTNDLKAVTTVIPKRESNISTGK